MCILLRLRLVSTGAVLVGAFTLATSTIAEDSVDAGGFSALGSMESQELAELSGREGFKNLINVQSFQTMEANVSGASFMADSIVSGNITVQSNAMDRVSGITLMNLMTGHSNAVNTGVSISINISQ